MRQGSTERQARRNLTLPDSAMARLAQLKESTGAASDSEVIRQALRVYATITQKDAEIILRDRTTGKETTLLIS